MVSVFGQNIDGCTWLHNYGRGQFLCVHYEGLPPSTALMVIRIFGAQMEFYAVHCATDYMNSNKPIDCFYACQSIAPFMQFHNTLWQRGPEQSCTRFPRKWEVATIDHTLDLGDPLQLFPTNGATYLLVLGSLPSLIVQKVSSKKFIRVPLLTLFFWNHGFTNVFRCRNKIRVSRHIRDTEYTSNHTGNVNATNASFCGMLWFCH